MLSIKGYTIAETSKENGSFYFDDAVRNSDGLAVFIKSASLKNSKATKLLEHEYDVAAQIESDWGIKAISLERGNDYISLVFENFRGKSLNRYINNSPLELNIFLKLAINIAKCISKMHEKGIIHKNIKPDNIIIEPESNEVRIMDFGIASMIPEHLRSLPTPTMIEGSLSYMAPEQTGRMNHVIDHRADLYALGITFYEMLTGKLPFETKEPLHLIYSHLVQIPIIPDNVLNNTNQVVSDIILKLLSKQPDNRYQSADGLIADLQKSFDQYTKSKKIENFRVGENDISGELPIPQKLYGRDDEIKFLLNEYEKFNRTGIPLLLMVSGYSGIGKTSLINELMIPITQKGGFLIMGKFDQFKRNIPYATLVESFRTMTKIVLSEKEGKLNEWKNQILDAVGNNGQLIIDVIPQVELIIGKQQPVAALPPDESKNRFETVFENFISVFSTKDHPLTMFLDDLQWVDTASMNLIHKFMTDEKTKYLCLIGAYRENEVSPTHPLVSTLNKIKESTPVSQISLVPLQFKDIEQLLSDTFKSSSQNSIKELTELILDKTGGNPFFIIQFLKAVHKEKLIWFDKDDMIWKWDITKIVNQGYTNNVIDLLVGKIQKLNPLKQEILKYTSCIGPKFEKKLLLQILERENQEITLLLNEIIAEGLLFYTEGFYKFIHDRIQQAAYSIIPKKELSSIHIHIGRVLLENSSTEKKEENIFEIASQFNRGNLELMTAEEKIKLAEVNLLAGKKAKDSIAYQSALNFLNAGINLLPENSWKKHYELAFNIYLEKAYCEWQEGNYDETGKILDDLSNKAKNNIDYAKVTNLKIDFHTTREENPKSIEAGISLLKRFGIKDLDPHPTWDRVIQEKKKTEENLSGRNIESLSNAPVLSDPELIAVIRTIAAMIPSAILTDNNLYCLLMSIGANFSIQHGNSEESPAIYASWGNIVGAFFEDQERAYLFGKLGYDLTIKYNLQPQKARVFIMFSNIISPFFKPFKMWFELLPLGFDYAIESGNKTYACYYCNHTIARMILMGENLEKIYNQTVKFLDYLEKANFELVEVIVQNHQRFVNGLRGESKSISTYTSKDFDEIKHEAYLEENKNTLPLAFCWYHIWKSMSRFISGDYHQALSAAERATEIIAASQIFIEITEYYYYYSLAILAVYHELNPEEKEKQFEILLVNQEKLRKLAGDCKENFTTKYGLVSAEIARITDKKLEAINLYELAINAARENDLIQNEAIAYEVASKFYREDGFEVFADSYIKKAHNCYSRWGAYGKVKQMEKIYPSLREQQPIAGVNGIAIQHLDLNTIIKASQAISSPLEIQELNESLMRIVMEQAGARKGVLLLEQNDQLVVATEAILNGDLNVNTYESPKPFQPDFIPEKIIRYVKRTKELVILDDASQNNSFNTDKYITRNHTKSIISLPIIKQTKLIGILYLENNLITGAFTADKISVLELLASQAAISIENAIAYKELNYSEIKLKEYKHFFNNTQDFSCIANTEGYFEILNPNFEKMLGYSNKELLENRFINFLHPDDVESTLQEFEKLKAGASTINFKNRYRKKDGTYLWFDWNATPNTTNGKLYGIARDITKQIETEAIQKKRELELASIFDTVADVIFVLEVEKDDKYRFQSVNRAFIATTGIEENQIIGARVNDIIPEPSLSLVLNKYKHAIEGKKNISWEETTDYPTGKLTGIVSIAPVFDESGNCIQLIGSVKDFST